MKKSLMIVIINDRLCSIRISNRDIDSDCYINLMFLTILMMVFIGFSICLLAVFTSNSFLIIFLTMFFYLNFLLYHKIETQLFPL